LIPRSLLRGGSLDELEKLGEQEVRKRLASNVYGDPRNSNHISVQTWLRSKECEREEALNNESLSISRKALAASEEANRLAADANCTASNALVISRKHERWAMYAVIIAIVAAIIATMAYIKSP
jgi:hypothetical protein